MLLSSMSEEERLAQADQHISDAERRITEQEERVAKLEAAGEDTREGKRLLDAFRLTLVELHVHRRAIIANLDSK